MRKAAFFTVLTIFLSLALNAQDESDLRLGIKLAPTFGNSRVLLDDPANTVENDGSAFRLSIGLIADREFGNGYIFSSGVIYIPKEVSIAASGTGGNVFNTGPETYKLQYLQIPGTVKLFTNEIQPDVKIYFQLGMALEIKVYEEADTELDEPEVIAQFQPFNIPVILGTGFEYKAGVNTTIFAGVSYQRGLTNIVESTNTNYEFAEAVSIRTTLLSIDAGVKF